jgi:hypothetical protein
VITASIPEVQWQRHPPSSFVVYNKTVGSAVVEVIECSTMQVAREASTRNEVHHIQLFVVMAAGQNVGTLPGMLLCQLPSLTQRKF